MGEREQTTGSLPCSLPKAGQACSLYEVRVGVCPGIMPEGWLRCFTHPLGGVVCRRLVQYPVLLQPLQKWQLGFFGLCIFGVQNLPQLCMHTLIFSPIQFLCILLLKERCVQVQALQHCSKGLQVPAKRHRFQPVSQPSSHPQPSSHLCVDYRIPHQSHRIFNRFLKKGNDCCVSH